jgi:hypothetical protein
MILVSGLFRFIEAAMSYASRNPEVVAENPIISGSVAITCSAFEAVPCGANGPRQS